MDMKLQTKQSHSIVMDEAITGIIIAVLVYNGYRGEELRDAIAEVRVRLIEALERRTRLPQTLAQWKALAAKVAKDLAIDEHREAQTRAKYDAGPCEDPDAYLPLLPSGEQRDPVDAKRQLAVLLELFDKGEMPEHGREILLGVADRVKLTVIGRELGLPRKEVESRLRKMRRRFFARLAALGMMVMMMALVVIVAVPVVVGTGAAPTPSRDPVYTLVTASTPTSPVPSPLQRAHTLRRDALRACEAKAWEECLDKLDEAARIDPASDDEPGVQAARHRANEGLLRRLRELEAKPR